MTIGEKSVSVEVSAGTAGRVVGDGQPASESRTIATVRAVHMDGAFALTIKPGPPGLTVETDKNLLPIVKTEVTGGRLDLYTDRSYAADRRIEVTLFTPQIAGIFASGSSRIDGEGLGGDKLSVTLDGANSAVLTGKVAALSAQLRGANRLTAERLTADAADIAVDGSGTAVVFARERIAARVSGAGSIEVHGNPEERDTQITGAGKIDLVR